MICNIILAAEDFNLGHKYWGIPAFILNAKYAALHTAPPITADLFLSFIILGRIASGVPWFLCSTAEPMQHPYQCWR